MTAKPFKAAMRNVSIIVAAGFAMAGDVTAGLTLLGVGLALSALVNR